MASGIELATAYVSLTASTRQLVKDINSAFDRAEVEAKRSGKSVGQVMSDNIGSTLNSGLRSEMTQAGKRAGGRFSDSFEGSVDGRGTSRRLTGQLESDADASGKKAGRRFASSFESEASKANANMRAVGREGGAEAGGGFSDGFGAGVAGIAARGGPFAAAIAAAVTAAKVIGPQIEAAMQFEVGRDLVQARLGLDEASMAGIAKSASAAFSQNWGTSIEANMDTAAVAIQAGLLKASDDGGAQAKMIGQLNAVSQILGEDIPSVVRSASQAIRTGIADDATGAFDLLVVAQQNGLNVSGDLLDTVNEYSTQFRKLGLSGPEAFGLISQAVKNGARDTDIAADALKEFSIRAIDNSEMTRDAYARLSLDADAMTAKFAAGGKSARDAFVEVTDAIRGVKDPADKAAVSVALFGTQAEDLGGAMDSFDLSKAVNEFGNVEKASQAAADKMTSNAANEWETAKNTIIGKINEIRNALNMGDWFSSIPKAINDAFAPDAVLTPGAPGVPWQPGNAIQGGAPAGKNPLDVFAPTGEQGADGLFPAAAALKGRYSEWGFTGIGGYNPTVDQKWDEHHTGTAIDVPIPGGNSGAGISVVQDALRQPGTQHVIWQQKTFYPDGRVEDMPDRGSPTENHMDHVHIKTYDQGGFWPSGTLGINTTGKDEYVLTPEQLADLRAMPLGVVNYPAEPIGPKDRTRPGGVPDLGPGKSGNQIALPDWGKQVDEGGAWGAPPPGWWTKPVNPEDRLFPEWWPPGMREIWADSDPRIKGLSGIRRYDSGGAWPTGTLGVNTTGEDEWVLTPEQIEELKKQGIDPATMQHGMAAPAGLQPGLSPEKLAELTSPPGLTGGAELLGGSRTEGYIPAGAGSTAVAGESFMSGIYSMGAEVINGIIDQAASAASSAAGMALTAGTFGAGAAGAPAASAATAAAIGMGTQAAKRGVEYGAQMLGILTDATIEQLTPFGAPRLLTTDPTGFMPQQALMEAATTSLEKAFQPQQPQGPEQPEPVPAGGVTSQTAELEPGMAGNDYSTTIHATVKDVNELGRVMTDQQKLKSMQYSGRP